MYRFAILLLLSASPSLGASSASLSYKASENSNSLTLSNNHKNETLEIGSNYRYANVGAISQGLDLDIFYTPSKLTQFGVGGSFSRGTTETRSASVSLSSWVHSQWQVSTSLSKSVTLQEESEVLSSDFDMILIPKKDLGESVLVSVRQLVNPRLVANYFFKVSELRSRGKAIFAGFDSSYFIPQSRTVLGASLVVGQEDQVVEPALYSELRSAETTARIGQQLGSNFLVEIRQRAYLEEESLDSGRKLYGSDYTEGVVTILGDTTSAAASYGVYKNNANEKAHVFGISLKQEF